MDLFYGRGDAIERADNGWMESGAAVIARVQPRAKAVAGPSKSVAFDWVWCVVRHDGPCRVTITPIVDGKARVDLTATYDFAAVDFVKDEVVRLQLTEPVTFPGDSKPFSRQALRGTWLTVRATLQPLGTLLADPQGTLFGLGGFETAYTPVGPSGPSIPIAGGG